MVLSVEMAGQCSDTAVAESFFATIKRELIDTRSWPTRAGLRAAVFDDLKGWYHTRRLHSSLRYRSPAEYEAAIHHNANRQAAESTQPTCPSKRANSKIRPLPTQFFAQRLAPTCGQMRDRRSRSRGQATSNTAPRVVQPDGTSVPSSVQRTEFFSMADRWASKSLTSPLVVSWPS